MIEQVKDATTPSEMRAEIYRLRGYDPMVRMVIDMSDYNGLSSEDRYTILAYHALKEKQYTQSRLFKSIQMSPPPVTFMDKYGVKVA